MWLNGPIASVTAMTETFIKERQHVLTGKVEKVGIDDASLFLARFANGSLGTFESTRYARGHKALYTFEINGEHGSIFWDLHDLHRLQYFDHRDEGRARLALDPRDRRRPSLHGQVVGAGPATSATSTASPPGGRLHPGAGVRQAARADLPRRAGHGLRDRRRAQVGEDRPLGEDSAR
jgi:predicted dehydrogenase